MKRSFLTLLQPAMQYLLITPALPLMVSRSSLAARLRRMVLLSTKEAPPLAPRCSFQRQRQPARLLTTGYVPGRIRRRHGSGSGREHGNKRCVNEQRRLSQWRIRRSHEYRRRVRCKRYYYEQRRLRPMEQAVAARSSSTVRLLATLSFLTVGPNTIPDQGSTFLLLTLGLLALVAYRQKCWRKWPYHRQPKGNAEAIFRARS